MKRRTIIVFAVLWGLMLIIPYIIGFLVSDDQHFFLGFLLNPIDGATYLAKMRQGVAGFWTFHLPYSAFDHSRVFLFSFYLFIGKMTAFISTDMRLSFHLVRIICAGIFFFNLVKYLQETDIQDQLKPFAMFAVLFGGGLGWLYMVSGDIPADFWVAEAFPFLSAFTNPHFILSFAVILYILRAVNGRQYTRSVLIKIVISGFVLANISPFAVGFAGFILLIDFLWEYFFEKRVEIKGLIAFCLFSLPISIYQIFIVRGNDLLSAWNDQNITPAPSLVNFIFSFSPFLILNIILLFWVWKKKIRLTKRMITYLAWFLFATILIYLPINLQRRFMVGLFLPVVLLSFELLSKFILEQTTNEQKGKRISFAMVVLSVFSNLIILFGSISGVLSLSENLFIRAQDYDVIKWLETNADQYEVVLSEENLGLYIPAFTNLRVVIGHPFETPNYESTKSDVEAMYANPGTKEINYMIEKYSPDFIVFKNEDFDGQGLPLGQNVFENDDYLIFRIH